MSRSRVSLLIPLVLVLGIGSIHVAPAGAALDSRMIPESGTAGTSLTTILAPAEAPSAPLEPHGPRNAELVWHRYLADPIYTTVGARQFDVFAGDYLNSPREVERIPSDGDGTPSWVFGGNEFYVDASSYGPVLAALDATPDSTVTVRQWDDGSSTPLWDHSIHPCRPLDGNGWSAGKGIQIPPSGQFIATVVNMYTPDGLRGRLVVFAPGSPDPIVDYPLDGTASALAAAAGGRYVAIYAWPSIYVYDVEANTLRWSGAAGAGNDALAISEDGDYIAWGWSSLYLRRWNGTTYESLWTGAKAGYYVTECAISGDKLAAAWYKGSTFDDSVIDMLSLPSHALLWSYSYASEAPAPDDGRQNPVDIISEMVASLGFLSAASWGPTFPEIHVFDMESPEPIAVYDTPGTMFDIDHCDIADDGLYITACGKHVHAGQAGRGADLYLLKVPHPLGVEEPGAPSDPAVLQVAPNPSSGPVRIEFRAAAAAGLARFSVHDASGRVMANLVSPRMPQGSSPGGSVLLGTVRWDGRDLSGRPVPPGVYFIRMESGTPSGERGGGRVVILR